MKQRYVGISYIETVEYICFFPSPMLRCKTFAQECYPYLSIAKLLLRIFGGAISQVRACEREKWRSLQVKLCQLRLEHYIIQSMIGDIKYICLLNFIHWVLDVSTFLHELVKPCLIISPHLLDPLYGDHDWIYKSNSSELIRILRLQVICMIEIYSSQICIALTKVRIVK
jgi:hypothetical protein